MRKILVVLLILSLIPVSAALFEKPLFEGWVKSGSTFEADGQNFTIIHNKNTNTTVIYFPNSMSTVINAQKDQCTSEWIYRACQTKQRFEKNGIEVPADIHDAFLDIYIYLLLNTTNIRLDLYRDFDADEVYAGEFIDITADINKTGKGDITNITFIDRYSEDFLVIVLSGCEKDGNNIIWTGDLNYSSGHSCKYKIKPIKKLIFNNNATLSYYLFEKSVKKDYSYRFFVEDTPLIFKVDYKNRTKTGENFKVNLSFNALNELSINNVKVMFQDNLELVNYSPGFSRHGFQLDYKGKVLEKNDELKLFVEFSTGIVNEYDFEVHFDYVYNDVLKTIQKKFITEVYGEVFQVELKRFENHSLLRISNPSKEDFTELRINILNYTFRIDNLASGKFKEFTFPLYDEGRYGIEVSYRSQYGQILRSNYNIEYGEANYYKASEKTLVEQEEQAAEEKKETSLTKKKNKQEIELPLELILLIFGVILLVIIALSLISRKSGPKSIDLEIEEIEKQEEEPQSEFIEN